MKSVAVSKDLLLEGLEFKDEGKYRIYKDEAEVRRHLEERFKKYTNELPKDFISIYLTGFTHYSPEVFIETQLPFILPREPQLSLGIASSKE